MIFLETSIILHYASKVFCEQCLFCQAEILQRYELKDGDLIKLAFLTAWARTFFIVTVFLFVLHCQSIVLKSTVIPTQHSLLSAILPTIAFAHNEKDRWCLRAFVKIVLTFQSLKRSLGTTGFCSPFSELLEMIT